MVLAFLMCYIASLSACLEWPTSGYKHMWKVLQTHHVMWPQALDASPSDSVSGCSQKWVVSW